MLTQILEAAEPKVAIPVAKAVLPKVQPKIAQPTAIAKAPVAKTVIMAKTVVPKTAQAKQIIAKTVAIPAAKTIQQPKTSIATDAPTIKTTAFTIKLPITINVKNTSNFSGKLTGFTIIHKDKNGNNHLLSQTIPNTKFIIPPASAKKTLPIEFKLKAAAGTFFVGTSAVFINDQEISTIYKKQPWNRGITDAIYVTSKNGSNWKLDIKAMNAAYQKLSTSTNAPASVKNKVTPTTKAAAIPVMQEHKKTKKLSIAKSTKSSKRKTSALKAAQES